MLAEEEPLLGLVSWSTICWYWFLKYAELLLASLKRFACAVMSLMTSLRRRRRLGEE